MIVMTIRTLFIVAGILAFFRFLWWLLTWYEYQRDLRMPADDIATLEAEYRKLIEDYRQMMKRRSMKP